MDELKKHIRRHLNELDIDEPGPGVWEHIRSQSQPPVQKANVVMMAARWAVAACVLVLAGIGIWHIAEEKHGTPAVTATTEQPKQQPVLRAKPAEEPKEVMASHFPEVVEKTKPKTRNNIAHKPAVDANIQTETTSDLAMLHNVESSFTQVINLQRERVASTPMYAESPAYFKDFKIQIRQMEKDEQAIKSDIAKRGMNDELLDQLINLYQQKLNTLKQLQTEMNKTNNRYKQHRGPVDPTKTYFLKL